MNGYEENGHTVAHHWLLRWQLVVLKVGNLIGLKYRCYPTHCIYNKCVASVFRETKVKTVTERGKRQVASLLNL